MSNGIAIVGIGCRYPDANSPKEFWENILAKRRAFRRMPDERLSLESYYSSDRNQPDKTYSPYASLIHGFEFDRVRYRIAGSTFRATDIAQWLALQVTEDALRDAGYDDPSTLPRDTTGVVLGNTLTGEISRANTLRLRWPYVRKTLLRTLINLGVAQPERDVILSEAEKRFKSAFPEMSHENLAGGLSNTIPGRVCNHFDFHGGGYTVDGACAASLLAVSSACSHLESHDMDVALAGGVDISLDPFELIGFAKMGALAEKEMFVYDERSSGFLPGEGCGIIVLKRLDDAVNDGNRIYAVIRGWGISSDGQGGLTTPSTSGQAFAVRRAYKRAGYDIAEVSLIEGHGTGTTVGDKIELAALASVASESSSQQTAGKPMIGVGSVKANIGHTKAAAGIAGLIKSTLAVYNQILPPMPGCTTPHTEFKTSSLYPLRSARLWDENRPLRAGISAFGFGGINTHITIESLATNRRREYSTDERRLVTTSQDSEVFFFSARRTDELKDQLLRVFNFASRISQAEMTDLAAALAQQLHGGDVRAAIVASRPEELSSKIEQLLNIVGAAGGAQEFSHIDTHAGVFLARSARPVRVGYLYPGQGVQQINMGKLWYERYNVVREGFDRADRSVGQMNGEVLSRIIFRDIDRSTSAEHERWKQVLTQTRVAQPAIAATSVVMTKILKDHGVTPSLAIGYSLGEWTALWSSGMIGEEDLCRCVAARGRAMESIGTVRGGMATVAASSVVVEEVIRSVSGYVTIAGYNTQNQVVVSGEYAVVQDLVSQCRERGIPAIPLKVSNAFHSQLVSSAADVVRKELQPIHIGEALFPVISTITGMDVKRDQVKDILCDQILMPVRFLDAVKEAERFGIDVLVEVGPGRSLSNMFPEIDVRGLRCVLFTDDEGGATVRPMNMTLACLFSLGVPIKASHLFDARFTKPFSLDYNLKFIQNPCESDREETSKSNESRTLESMSLSRSSAIPSAAANNADAGSAKIPDGATISELNDVVTLVLDLAAAITEYPRESIKPDNLLLHDLNLNSIASAQLVAEAARKLGLGRPTDPTEYSTASLEQVAKTLFDLLSTRGSMPAPVEEEMDPPGIASWVRPFTIEMKESLPPTSTDGFLQPGMKCLIIAEANDPLLTSLQEQLMQSGISVHQCHGSLETFFNDPHNSATSWDGFIYIHPERKYAKVWEVGEKDLTAWHESSVRRMFSTAQAIAQWCTARKSHNVFVAAVARNSGFFGRDMMNETGTPFGACSGVFKSLHLEFDFPATCIIDCSSKLSPRSSAEYVVKELQLLRGFREVGFGEDGMRRVPVVRLAESRAPSVVSLNPSDVLLVTGGGRGVAAEWAFTIAQDTRCKVAIVGRTAINTNGSSTDGEVCATLKRFEDEKIPCRYYQCDVADQSLLVKIIDRIRHDVGTITAVLHAAGTNTPQATRNLSREVMEQTLAPKIGGTMNLLHALQLDKLKLFLTFGSIIGQSGMPGQAAYAFANEWMNRAVLQLQLSYPAMKCLSINSSVWSGIGMGQRLGSVDALAREGVAPIEPAKGLEIVLHLLRHEQVTPEIIMCGRVRRLPTLRLEEPSLPVLRFLERKRTHYPGVELITECNLSAAHDPYLNDHFVDGMCLFPAVLGMEAMVQVASSLCQEKTCTALERLEFPRAIMIPPGGTTKIRIIAQASQDATRVDVAIRSSETNYSLDHFRACVIFSADAISQPETQSPVAMQSSELLSLSPSEDLYGKILFQGPMFRHLAGYRELSATSCVADIRKRERANLFGAYHPQTLLTGDPTVRDVFLHAIQPCVPQSMILPLSIERIVFFHAIDKYSQLLLIAREREHSLREYVYDVEVRADDGTLVELFEGFRCRAVGTSGVFLKEGSEPPLSLLAPYFERHLQSIDPAESCVIALTVNYKNDALEKISSKKGIVESERRESSRKAFDQAIRDFIYKKQRRILDKEAFFIEYDSNGRPGVRMRDGKSSLYASAAHSDDVTCAIVSSTASACDVEKITVRADQLWTDLLGDEGLTLGSLVAAEMKEDTTTAYTRVWSVMECLKKSGMNHVPLPPLNGTDGRRWVTFTDAQHVSIHTVSFQDARTTIRYVAAFLVSRKDSATGMTDVLQKERHAHL